MSTAFESTSVHAFENDAARTIDPCCRVPVLDGFLRHTMPNGPRRPPSGRHARRNALRLLNADKQRDAQVSCSARATSSSFCSDQICPGIVKEDCSRWLGEIRAEVPSLLFRAQEVRGRQVIGVRVYANGTLLTSELDGKTVELDPGDYDIRYEARSGVTKSERITLKLGERRELSVRSADALESDGRFSSRPAKPATPRRTARVPPPARSQGQSDRSAPLRGRWDTSLAPRRSLRWARSLFSSSKDKPGIAS